MGTIPLTENKRITCSDGTIYNANCFTDTSSLQYPEEGCVWFYFTEHKKPKDVASHGLTICAEDYSEPWERRLYRAFAADADFRATLEVTDERHPHPTVNLELSGEVVAVDALIAAAILRLNELGVETEYCCQGVSEDPKNSGTAYIKIKSGEFPEDLVAAWEGAGFYFSYQSVHAHSLFGLEHVASAHFVQSLNDWMSSSLDLTGKRYRVNEARPDSRPKLPSSANEIPKSRLKKSVSKLNKLGPRAKFKDIASLRSGRDEFSKLNLPTLLGSVAANHPTAQAPQDIADNPAEHAKWARWVLRGLEPSMAERKIRTDLEIGKNMRGSR